MKLSLKIYRPASQMALILLGMNAAVLLGAYGFEIIGGLAPCQLCYYQRIPYALAIAVCVLVITLPQTSRMGFMILILIFITSAGLGAYHAGVEWQWWKGPAGCTASGGTGLSVEELMAQILAAPIVRCDEIPWSLFGISLAGYNALISLGLAGICLYALRKETAHGGTKN